MKTDFELVCRSFCRMGSAEHPLEAGTPEITAVTGNSRRSLLFQGLCASLALQNKTQTPFLVLNLASIILRLERHSMYQLARHRDQHKHGVRGLRYIDADF